MTRIRKREWEKWVRKDSRVIEHGQLGSYRKEDKELVLEIGSGWRGSVGRERTSQEREGVS